MIVAVVALIVVLAVVLIPRAFGDSKAESLLPTCFEPNGGVTRDRDTVRVAYPNGERTDEFWRALDCFVNESGMPATVEDPMNFTSDAKGKDSASWEGWDASWTYGVEDGLKLSLTNK